MTSNTARITTAAATREGSGGPSGDAYAIHTLPGTQIVGAAITDGIGHGPAVAEMSQISAQVAARVATRRHALSALLAAGSVVSVPADHPRDAPNGVSIAAVTSPGHKTEIAWIGDCRAYGWADGTLDLLTTDHSVGNWLRHNTDEGIELLAAAHDNWSRGHIGWADVWTVHTILTAAPLVLLTSDGVHAQIPPGDIERLVAEHADNPQTLADALVAAVQPDLEGYRDDATVVVIQHT
ncbi:PP2C family protein-serine/threonine phosphatase [Streptomyces avicenniae]|uniref:PP2C family protein-serine/threonine phosphatase n=1 Tax=Streptomyces avicenniae TaxID=500153 RepID=UPI00069ACC4B|nr:SpoIIE family protein phosphatase [Streptomyces avicenniae]